MGAICKKPDEPWSDLRYQLPSYHTHVEQSQTRPVDTIPGKLPPAPNANNSKHTNFQIRKLFQTTKQKGDFNEIPPNDIYVKKVQTSLNLGHTNTLKLFNAYNLYGAFREDSDNINWKQDANFKLLKKSWIKVMEAYDLDKFEEWEKKNDEIEDRAFQCSNKIIANDFDAERAVALAPKNDKK